MRKDGDTGSVSALRSERDVRRSPTVIRRRAEGHDPGQAGAAEHRTQGHPLVTGSRIRQSGPGLVRREDHLRPRLCERDRAAGQVDDALADSRIDIGSVIVALEPSKFPASNVLWYLSFVGSQNPVEGLLEWHGAMLQAASSSDAIQQEYEANGMHVLFPVFSSGPYF